MQRRAATGAHLLEAFRDGLRETGFVDGKNVALDIRWADGRYDEVPAMLAAVVATEPNRRTRIIALASERKLSAIYPSRGFAADGGLMSYGARWSAMYKIAGNYAGRLLKGAEPADLPVQRPNTYEMVLNMSAARLLGLTLPPLVLNRADEVLE
jgi:putative ABC transport system substrate-binding protein